MSFGSPCIRVSPHPTPRRRPPICIKNYKVRKPTFRRPCTTAHAWLLPTRPGSPYGSYPHTTTVRPCARRDLRYSRPTAHPRRRHVSGTVVPPPHRHGIIPSCPRPHARRDQRPAYPDPRIQPVCSNFPVQRRGALRRRRRGLCVQARLKAGACGPRRGSPGNLGRLDSAKVRRHGAGSAGRMTDHAGRRPDPTRQKVDVDPRKVRRTPAITAAVFSTLSTLPFPSRVFPFSLFSLCPISR